MNELAITLPEQYAAQRNMQVLNPNLLLENK
jgi:hypothetical protein